MTAFSGVYAAILRGINPQTPHKPTRLRFYQTNFLEMMIWLFLNLMVSAPFGYVGQMEKAPFAMEELVAKPAIVEWLTELDHDFQHLRQEHPKTFVFRFKNIDKQPIILQTVRTSCGCTAATWTETPIAPGETGQIEVEYDAYQKGEFRKKIRVFFDRQRKPEILWIHGEVD